MISVTFPIPTVKGKLKPFIEAVEQLKRIAKAEPSNTNVKELNDSKQRLDNKIEELLKSDPMEMCEYYWELYHKSISKTERKTLKKMHNDLAEELNRQAKRKMYLLIH